MTNQQKIFWKPHPVQEKALKRTEYEILFGGARGGGKGFCNWEKILTPFGWKEVKDILIGDQVCNPDGSVSRVIALFKRGKQPVYKFNFTSGASVTIDEDHLWLGKFVGHKIKRNLDYKLYTTKQILEKYQNDEHPRLMIPLTKAVQFTRPKETRWGDMRPIDPYLLGLLLGDGCITGKSLSFATCDQEIVDYCEKKLEWTSDGKASFRIKNGQELKKQLQDLKLLGTYSHTKFIPENYLWSSIEERLAILQGLMDTDGTVDKDGRVSFTSTSEKLVKDVQFLARSLGYKATVSGPHDSVCNKQKKKDHFDVYINGSDLQNVFRLTRKKERCTVKQPQHWQLALENIEICGEEETICFQVDNPNGLIITNDFIVTHNTDAGLAWFLYFVDNSLLRGLVIRRNADDLRDWVDRARLFYKVVGGEVVGNPPEVRFPSGAIIRTGHLKDEGAYTKYQGHEYQKMLLEELDQIPREQDYIKLLGSCRSTVDGLDPQIFCTTNPGGVGAKWIKKRWQLSGIPKDVISFPSEKTGRTRAFVPATVKDNPTLVEKDPDYVKSLDELPDGLREAWRDGSWDAFDIQGAYYTMQIAQMRKEGRIMNVPWDESLPVHTWWDLGIGDATSIGFFQHFGNEWRIIDYLEEQGEGLTYFKKVLDDKPYYYQDHWAPHDIQVRELTTGHSRFEQASKMGLRFKIVPKIPVDDGINSLRMRFGTLWIDEKKCEKLLDALQNYHREWSDTLNDFKPKPHHDWSSHACLMAGTKILTGNGEKNIEDIEVGDLVITPFGKRKVLDSGISGVATKIYNVIFSNGSSLNITGNHKIFTSCGFKTIDTLSYGDTMESVNKLNLLKWKILKLLFLKEKNIGFREIITQRTEEKNYIGMSGKNLMVKFLMGTMSTIKMVIGLIIKLRIWCWLKVLNICLAMAKSGGKIKILGRKWKTDWSWLVRQPRNGMLHQMAGSGTPIMPKSVGQKESLFLKNVLFVKKNIKQLFQGGQNFVPINANQDLDDYPKRTISKLFVSFVKKVLAKINTKKHRLAPRAVQINCREEQSVVYNLTVEKDNVYYANGILVSNSDMMRYWAVSSREWFQSVKSDEKKPLESIYNPYDLI